MSDFASSWDLSRQRLLETISDLSDAQLNWRIHENALSIGQMAVHVAGVEMLFSSQLLDKQLEGEEARIRSSATDGVVNDKPFPFADSELTKATVQGALAASKKLVEPIITNPSSAILEKELISALGPVITGRGALTRLAFHSAYHQGQAYMMRTAPGFPPS
jgi:hypothetical protein